MGRRAPLAVAACAAVVAAGCGGGDAPAPAPAPDRAPRLPFPPQAGEPGKAPPSAGAPRGRIVRVGGRPEGVAVLDGVAGVGVKAPGGDRLVLIDVASGRVLRRVPIPGAPRHVGVGGGRFLVPAEAADELAFVSRAGRVATVRVGDNPHDVTWADGTAYTGDEFGSAVTEVRGGRAVRSVPVDAQPGGVVALGTSKLAVVSVRAYTVELFDRRTLRGGGSQNVGYGPSHAVATPDGRLVIADTRGGGLSVFSTRPRLRFEARVAVPGSPYGLALDGARDRLWVTRTARDQVSEIALSGRPRVVRSLPTVRQPNTVAVDPRTGRLVVASATDGTVQLLDP